MAGALLHQVRALLVAMDLQKSRIWRLAPTSEDCSRTCRGSLFRFRLGPSFAPPSPRLDLSKKWGDPRLSFHAGRSRNYFDDLRDGGINPIQVYELEFGEWVVFPSLSHHDLLG